MLTVDYRRLALEPGHLLLDMGAGAGRHAFESYRRGARVIALDYDAAELKDVAGLFAAMQRGRRGPAAAAAAAAVNGDGTGLPFPDDTFDRIVCSEVLEHIPDLDTAISELHRVLKPSGTMAVTVPTWFPEKVCWALSEEYHAPFVPGGHIRIFTESALRSALRGRRLPTRRLAPRARPALAVLVAEVRGRAHQRHPPDGAGRTTGSWCGTSHRPPSSPAGPRRP